jgi:hypothetical protein
MNSALRRVAVLALMVAFLSPGFMQARTVRGDWDAATAASRLSSDGSFFSMVWNLLTSFWANSGAGQSLTGAAAQDTATGDNGGHLDPNGGTTSAATPPDNGGHLDPNG